MVRSIPEKTFEHWASMYVAHRFARGGLWWPTRGEDIHVEDLGTLPGKSILLETKVPEQAANGTHTVTIKLAQLHSYTTSLVPVYYVFPEPPWHGDLMASGWLGRERRADLAYKRAGDRWFGEWTFVCRATALMTHLAPIPGQITATLQRPPPVHWRWFDFWTELAQCGSQTMPAAFVLPMSDVAVELESGNGTITRAELRAKLLDLRVNLLERGRAAKPSHKQHERERYMDELRSTRKAVLVRITEPGRDDLYREVSNEELSESFEAVMAVTDSDVTDIDGGDAHLALSAVPFNSLAP